MNPRVLFLFLAALLSHQVADGNLTTEPVLASMTWTKEDGFKLIENQLNTNDANTVAVANFTNAINQTGWSYLEVTTYPQFPDKVQAFAAGWLEGHVTSEVLYMYWQNTVDGYCDGKEKLCDKIEEFVNKNTKWVHGKLKEHRHHGSNPYWHQLSLIYDQLEGLEHGYDDKARRTKAPMIPHRDLFWMNIFGDLEDLEPALDPNDEFNKTRILGSGSCSALIKILPNNSDLYVAHDTWNSYQSMLRILKKYDFAYHWTQGHNGRHKIVPGKTLTFSGYPGVIYSGDDFTISSSGLTITETTIGNSNKELWKFVKPHGRILEGFRSLIANRLAKTGKMWSHIFARRNSGTYNNQWMVVDYKKFKPGKKLPRKGLLWILEQLPGHIHMDDLTSVLTAKSYWPSYNTPYYKDIFNMSGSPANVKKFGDWFTYDKTPRALIFKRDHRTVKDLDSMIKVMRYNNFQKDPLSKCDCDPPFSAENAISARNDLNPANGTYPFGSLGHRSHGGTDMKLTSSKMAQNLQFVAYGGPTYDDLPPFQWSKVDFAFNTPHFGHPDLWQFKPVTHQWHLN